MFDNKAQLLKMVQRYLSGKATAEERKFIESYYDFFEHKQNVLDQLLLEEKKLLEERMQANIMAGREMPGEKARILSMWSPFIKISAAAILLAFCLAGAYRYFYKTNQQTIALGQDIPPASNQLVLATNGHQIILDRNRKGIIAKQGNTVIDRRADGTLVYSSTGTGHYSNQVKYDTLTAPQKGFGSVVLSDGTTIWLNAVSCIRYPHSFTGKYRTVELLYGEAYYEVKHNAKQPFRVMVAGQTIQDIGTHFNINAYNDSASINTTLLEGSISLAKGARSAILKPGQQAQVKKGDNQVTVVNNADINQVVAWKNGLFSYDTASLDMIMKQVERWYGVKVVYQQDVQAEFVAKLPRNLPLSDLLTLLELTKQVHFKLEGKTLNVMK